MARLGGWGALFCVFGRRLARAPAAASAAAVKTGRSDSDQPPADGLALCSMHRGESRRAGTSCECENAAAYQPSGMRQEQPCSRVGGSLQGLTWQATAGGDGAAWLPGGCGVCCPSPGLDGPAITCALGAPWPQVHLLRHVRWCLHTIDEGFPSHSFGPHLCNS